MIRKKELTFTCLNCNCSAGYGYRNKGLSDISKVLNLKEGGSDVVILNEIYKYPDYDQFRNKFEEKYLIIEYPRTVRGENEVFIALKKETFSSIDEIEVLAARENEKDRPDYLGVILKYKDSKVAIIGARVRWHGTKCGAKYKLTEETFKFRRQEFYKLLEVVDELKERGIDEVFIGADMNHARIIGNEEDVLDEKQIELVYGAYLQRNYNYHLVKNEWLRRGMYIVTPNNEIGSVISKSGNVSQDVKIDHLIIPDYWNVKNKEYEFTTASDHAKLNSTISRN